MRLTTQEQEILQSLDTRFQVVIEVLFLWFTINIESVSIYTLSLISGVRTAEEQLTLFKIGRSYDDENSVWLITDPKIIVTYCDGTIRKSNHQFESDYSNGGRALDIVLRNKYNGRAIWYENATEEARQIYMLIGQQAKKLRIRWGGDFRRLFDPGHLEMPIHYELPPELVNREE